MTRRSFSLAFAARTSDRRAGRHDEFPEGLHDRLVVGPGFPSPIVRPSTSTTGATSAADPVMKASSAAHMSHKVKNFSLASRRRGRASSRTVSRDTPGRYVEVKRFAIVWLRTLKTVS